MKLEDALKSGDACTKCHVGIYRYSYNTVIAPALCYECKKLGDPEEIDHARLIRCPKCRHTWNINDVDGYDHYAEGEHKVECLECEHEFGIVTEVSYTFTSPELEAEEQGRAADR